MSDMSIEHATKIATLEVEVRHLTDVVKALSGHVATLNSVMDRLRGVLWFVSSVGGVIGFFLAKAFTAIPWGSLMPR